MMGGVDRSSSVWAWFPVWGEQGCISSGNEYVGEYDLSDNLMAGLNCTVVGSNIGPGVVPYEPSC